MKKLITLLLTLCVLFSGIISINASEMIFTELESVNIGTEEELQPMMARSCGNLSSWYDIDHATKGEILGDVEGNWQSRVGSNPDIYYDDCGSIYLCGTGKYSGRTYATDLKREWYS